MIKGQWSNEDIKRWISVFQLRVNDLVDSDGLQFTCEIWKPDTNIVNETTILSDKITVIKGKYFPFLDTEMYWNANNKLRFKVHLKENQ